MPATGIIREEEARYLAIETVKTHPDLLALLAHLRGANTNWTETLKALQRELSVLLSA